MAKIIANSIQHLSSIESHEAYKLDAENTGDKENIALLAKQNPQRHQAILTATRTIFSAVVPWLFEDKYKIIGAKSLFLYSTFCPTFQFANTLFIADVMSEGIEEDDDNTTDNKRAIQAQKQQLDDNTDEHAGENDNNNNNNNKTADADLRFQPEVLIPGAIAKCAKYLKRLIIVGCDPSCFTPELKIQLENANRSLPFLNFVYVTNGLHSNGAISCAEDEQHLALYVDAADVEVYLRFIQSEPLSRTENGRELKLQSAKLLAKVFSTALRYKYYSFRMIYLQNSKEKADEHGDKKNTNDDDDDDGEVEEDYLKDIVTVIKQAMYTQKRNYKLWIHYFRLLGALYSPVPDQEFVQHQYPMASLDLEVHYSWLFPKLAEMLHDLNSEYILFMEKRWPLAETEIEKRNSLIAGFIEKDNTVTVDEALINDLETERDAYEYYFHVFAQSLTYIVLDSREARENVLDDWCEELLHPLPQLINRILRYDFARYEIEVPSSSSSSSSSSLLSSKTTTVKKVVPRPSANTLDADRIVFQILGTFITFANEDKNDPSMHELCIKAFRIIPFSTLAKCIHLGRFKNLTLYAVKYVYDARNRGVWTCDDIISKSDEFLERIGYILKHSNDDVFKMEHGLLVMASDLLTKCVAFDFSRSFEATMGNTRTSFPRWEEDPMWMIRSAKRLEDCGILEACFQHLKNFDSQQIALLQQNLHLQSTEIFAFYVIDCCIFAEGLTQEAHEAKSIHEASRVTNSAFDSKLKWHSKFNPKKAQQYGLENASSAVLRIRKNIPDAVQILERFSQDVPRRFADYSADRFEACMQAIMTDEMREEAGMEKKKKSRALASLWETNYKKAESSSANTDDNNTTNKSTSPWTTNGWPATATAASTTTAWGSSSSSKPSTSNDNSNKNNSKTGNNTSAVNWGGGWPKQQEKEPEWQDDDSDDDNDEDKRKTKFKGKKVNKLKKK